MGIVFTLRLTSDDWEPGLHAWRCPALDIPSAFIEKARDGEGKPRDLDLLKIEKGPARVTWVGRDRPEQLSLAVGLGEELSPTSNEQFWKTFAIIVPIITALIGAGATYFSSPQSAASQSAVVHRLGLSVYPNGLEGSGLPPAKILINNREVAQPVDYQVSSDVDAVVDVNKAVEFAKTLGTAFNNQKSVAATSSTGVNDAVIELDGLSAKLNELAQLVGGNICSGGPSGVPAQASGRLVAQATEVSNRLRNIASNLNRASSIAVPSPK
jgi:hypothetical protein